jgi:hypothetical protein
MAQQPLVGQGLLIIDTQLDAPHSARLLWTSDQHDIQTHKRQTSMPPAGFESAVPASEQSQALALDLAAGYLSSTSYKTTTVSIR